MGQITIYIEGGGDQKRLKTECRKAFSRFFEKAGFKGHMPRLVACGSRQNAFDDFCIAMNSPTNENEVPFLLVDAEAPVKEAHKNQPWDHLKERDKWDSPDDVSNCQLLLMVQVMESWFLADSSALEIFFGRGFNSKALPRQPDIESISKKDVFQGLEAATRHTQKGKYGKGAHSFKILERIDPKRVAAASPWASQLLDSLSKALHPKRP